MSVISPELALVDPQLAAIGRAALHEPGCFVPASRPLVRPPAEVALLEIDSVATSRPGRRARRLALAGVGSATAISALLVLVAPRLAETPANAVIAVPALRAEEHAAAMRDAGGARKYVWPAVPEAQAYHVEILRDGDAVFAAATTKPSIVLPTSLRLGPGRYTWSATPSRPSGELAASAQPVVEATFVVGAGP